MAKKQVSVSIRKPSSSPRSDGAVSDADAFVQGGRPGHRVLSMSLPSALAERLSRHCAETGRDANAVLEDIVRRHFEVLDAPVVAQVEPAEKDQDPIRAVVAWVRARLPRMPVLARLSFLS